MNILFIANRFPYPPFRGDKLKIFNLATQLSKKHSLHLITFAETDKDYEYIVELEGIFKTIKVIKLPKWQSIWNVAWGMFGTLPLQVNYFKSRSFELALSQILKEQDFDAVHVQHLRMAQYAIEKKQLKRILDLPDAFSLYWQRRKTVKRNFFVTVLDNIESKRVLAYEKFILNEFNLNLVCSAEDMNFLINAHGVKNINVLPNGVDTQKFKPMAHDYSKSDTLLFTGNMDYAPNIDAVIYFVEEIFPLIKKTHPQVKFIIAGQRPVEKVLALANGADIEVTGFIPELQTMYNTASIVVAPLRFGAGTQNKVLEAMAMGIPVVCSNIGFEGLGIADGEGAFMRTDAISFSETVNELLTNEALRKVMGEKGSKAISENFSWEKIALILENYLSK
ncbi:MAG: glycosyltransferase [bacterium]|nr:glycosyltransferase [bacterium]